PVQSPRGRLWVSPPHCKWTIVWAIPVGDDHRAETHTEWTKAKRAHRLLWVVTLRPDLSTSDEELALQDLTAHFRGERLDSCFTRLSRLKWELGRLSNVILNLRHIWDRCGPKHS